MTINGNTNSPAITQAERTKLNNTPDNVNNELTTKAGLSDANVFTAINTFRVQANGNGITLQTNASVNEWRLDLAGDDQDELRIIESGIAVRFVILPTSGNVGIGTDNPAQKLDVSGNINASSTITANTFTQNSNAVVDIANSTFANLPADTNLALLGKLNTTATTDDVDPTSNRDYVTAAQLVDINLITSLMPITSTDVNMLINNSGGDGRIRFNRTNGTVNERLWEIVPISGEKLAIKGLQDNGLAVSQMTIAHDCTIDAPVLLQNSNAVVDISNTTFSNLPVNTTNELSSKADISGGNTFTSGEQILTESGHGWQHTVSGKTLSTFVTDAFGVAIGTLTADDFGIYVNNGGIVFRVKQSATATERDTQVHNDLIVGRNIKRGTVATDSVNFENQELRVGVNADTTGGRTVLEEGNWAINQRAQYYFSSFPTLTAQNIIAWSGRKIYFLGTGIGTINLPEIVASNPSSTQYQEGEGFIVGNYNSGSDLTATAHTGQKIVLDNVSNVSAGGGSQTLFADTMVMITAMDLRSYSPTVAAFAWAINGI